LEKPHAPQQLLEPRVVPQSIDARINFKKSQQVLAVFVSLIQFRKRLVFLTQLGEEDSDPFQSPAESTRLLSEYSPIPPSPIFERIS
jgi:hypothetical protein